MTLGNTDITADDTEWLGDTGSEMTTSSTHGQPAASTPNPQARFWPTPEVELDRPREAAVDESHLVTVITANYNGRRYLDKAIESVLNQSYEPIEYIIVDDGSTDGSRAVIERWQQRDERVKAIFLPDNAGVAHARNVGIQQSRGHYLTFLDADDMWHPEKVARQVAIFERQPRAGIVVTGSSLIGKNGESLKSPKRKKTAKQGTVNLYDFVAGRLPVSINAMTKRECIEKDGLFNPDYSIGEDYELWMRITRDYEYYFLDEPMHWYRVHDTNATRRDKLFNRESKVRILEDFVRKNPRLFDELGEDFKIVLQRKYNSLGKAYFLNGRLGEARKCFIKTLHLDAESLQRTKAKLWCLFLMMKGL